MLHQGWARTDKNPERRGLLTFSFSIARAAMSALLKLTKAQNLSCSTRILSISPHLRHTPNNSEDVKKSALLLPAVPVVWYWSSFIHLEKVPKVILGQLSRHISNPQRSAGASEGNKNITTWEKQHIVFRGKKHEWNPVTYPGCTTDWSWPPAARQKDRFKKHTHTEAASHYTHTLLMPRC